MKSSPIVQLLEALFVFFLFIAGAFLLVIGYQPERMWKLVEWLEGSQMHCFWAGGALVLSALFLGAVLIKLYGARVIEIKLHRPHGKVELDSSLIKNFIMEFWQTKTSFPKPNQVSIVSGGAVSITAKMPQVAIEALSEKTEQREELLVFEKDLVGAMQQQLGYEGPLILRWILPRVGK